MAENFTKDTLLGASRYTIHMDEQTALLKATLLKDIRRSVFVIA